MRTVRSISAAAAAAVLLVACGGDGNGDDGATADNGDGEAATGGDAITIAFANEVPYGYEGPDGSPTGQAPEVAKVVLEEMGYTDVSAEVVEFGALINGLNAGQFDMIAAGMFINEERASQALFTDPDY